MYPCPDCSTDVQERETRCPACDRDLTALATLHELPDAMFNKALDALKGKDFTTAISVLGAGLQYRFRDPGLWMLLGHAAIRLGAVEMAKNCFQMVQMLKRDYEPAGHALRVVNQIQAASGQADPSTPQNNG